jgi:hypothetical protein
MKRDGTAEVLRDPTGKPVAGPSAIQKRCQCETPRPGEARGPLAASCSV